MGSESTSGADKYGKWRNAYEYEKCNHEDQNKKVLFIK